MADLRDIGFEIIGQLVESRARRWSTTCKSSCHVISASRQMCFARLAVVTRLSSEVMRRWSANSAIKSAMLPARLCPPAARAGSAKAHLPSATAMATVAFSFRACRLKPGA
jgi:hypothetical protein